MQQASRFARFLALPWRDKLMLGRFALSGYALRGRLADPGRYQIAAREAATQGDVREASRLAKLANAAIGVTAGPQNCLLRSLVLSRELARRSIPHDLRIGARTDRPFIMAHAWIEVAGHPVNDTGSNLAGLVPMQSARASEKTDTALRPASGVLLTRSEEGAVLLSQRTGQYFGLDEVGLRLWDLLSEGKDLEQASETLAREYRTSAQTARRDCDELAQLLQDNGLIEAA